MQVANWILLRCRSTATLPLVASLAERQIEAWAPFTISSVRLGRVRKPKPIMLPVMPGFVFVAASQEQALADYLTSKPFAFRYFRVNGIGQVADADLDGLRSIAILDEPAPRAERFRIGEAVNVRAGPFVGKEGRAEKWDGSHYVVALVGFPLRFRAAPSLLERIQRKASAGVQAERSDSASAG